MNVLIPLGHVVPNFEMQKKTGNVGTFNLNILNPWILIKKTVNSFWIYPIVSRLSGFCVGGRARTRILHVVKSWSVQLVYFKTFIYRFKRIKFIFPYYHFQRLWSRERKYGKYRFKWCLQIPLSFKLESPYIDSIEIVISEGGDQ